MKDISKTYHNEEISVTWKPSLCIHSKKCWTQLATVFDPKIKPWINLEGANTEQVIKQIDICPSGALSYKRNNVIVNENNSKNKIEITPNGPILVYGSIELNHSNGKKELKEKVTALCRCGASANKPFCDGSHHKIGFSDQTSL